MNQRSIFIVFCMMIPFVGFGQALSDSTYIIGRLVHTSDQGGSFLPVMVLSTQDSSILKGSLTDSSGYFMIGNLPYDTYYISTRDISENLIILGTSFILDETHPSQDLGSVEIAPLIGSLDEITINEKKTLFKQKGDKLVVAIEGSFLAQGNKGDEILPLLPGVMLGDQGQFQINGKSSLILIDGKGEKNQEAIREQLKSINSENIQSVEIISNPSARYDASIKSIIHIKTKKRKSLSSINMYYGSQLFPYQDRTGLNYNSLTPGVRLNLGNERLKTSLYLSYGQSKEWSRYEDLREKGQQLLFRSTKEDSISKSYYRYGLDLEYDLSKKQTIGMSVNGGGNFFYENYSWLQTTFSNYDLKTFNLGTITPNTSIYFNSFYHIQLDKKGQELTFFFDSFRSISARNNEFINESSRNTELFREEIEVERPNLFATNQFSVNYVKPWNPSWQSDLGLKYTDFKSSTEYTYSDLDSSLSVNQAYSERIFASYATITGSIGKTQIDGGLRYEYVDAKNENDESPLGLRYAMFFPSFHLNHEFSSYQLSLSFSRKIRRPGLENVSQFINYLGPTMRLTGRANLRPTLSNQVELTWSNKNNVNLTLDYDLTNNWYANVPTEEDIYTFQFIPLEAIHTVGTGVYYRKKLFKIWHIITNSRLEYMVSQDDQYDLELSSLRFTISVNNRISLPKGYRLEASLRYKSPYALAFYEYGEVFYSTVRLKKSFLKGRLQSSFSLQDIFGTYVFTSYQRFGEDDLLTGHRLSNRRRFSISLSYQFETGNSFTRRNKRAKDFNESRTN